MIEEPPSGSSAKQVYERLLAAVHLVKVWLGDELISEGSAFAMLPTGELITAAHVVTGRTPIRPEDVDDPAVRIMAKAPGRAAARYRTALCGMTIEAPFFAEPVQLDLALLHPDEPLAGPIPHLPTKVRPPHLGERVLLGGFSDEVALPFSLPTLLKADHPGATGLQEALRQGFEADFASLMIKSGMVGNLRTGVFGVPGGRELRCDVFLVDNGMHSGASGGPVVNLAGDAVGFITQRALTPFSQRDTPNLEVPAGSTLCLSLQPLTALDLSPRWSVTRSP